MMMAENAKLGKLNGYFDTARDLFDYARQSAAEGTPIHAVERGIWQRVLQMGRQALGEFLVCQGDGDVGEKVAMPDGHEVKRLEERHLRCYQSIFGEFQLPRAVYGSREGQKIEYVPLDVRLQLPEGEFSQLLNNPVMKSGKLLYRRINSANSSGFSIYEHLSLTGLLRSYDITYWLKTTYDHQRSITQGPNSMQWQ